jgi:predicted nucleic acid-binding protein
MLLLDSSVWIDVHRGHATDATRYVEARDEHEELATTGSVFQEVLQGLRSQVEFERMRRVLWSALILEPRALSTYEIAAKLFRRARDKGLVIRNANACLVSALALEHGALLVHNDTDFLSLAQVEPALLVFPGRPH